MKKVLMIGALLVTGFIGGTVLPNVFAGGSEEAPVAYKECTPAEVVINEDNSDKEALIALLTQTIEKSDKSLTKEEIVALVKETKGTTVVAKSKSSASSTSTAAVVNEFKPVFNPVNNVIVANNNINNNLNMNNQKQEQAQGQIQDTKVVDKEKDQVIVTPAPTPEEPKKDEPKEDKPEKDKNNNGIGNGSEPADGTDEDVKGEDPSNPAHGDGEHPGKGKDKK